MLEDMPAETYWRWLEFDELEPFGAQRDDVRSAILGASVCNMLKGKRGRAFKLDDFMPDFRRKKAQTPDQMHAVMQQFAAMFEAFHGDH